MEMDMGSGMFQSTNKRLARDYWYIIAGILGTMVTLRLTNLYKSQQRLRRTAPTPVDFPTKPSNKFLEIWATLTAVIREASYPQLYVPVRFISWLTPPPLGRVVVLLVYWAVIVYMTTWNAVVKDVMFWERIGYRNAWVTVMQVPLLYLLASKCSILGLIAGSSYERLNWLHRWVARTMFVTATVHWIHFYIQWQQADMVGMMIGMMPMIKYGFGAWAIMLWSMIASLAPIRRLSYEIFVVQHILSAVVFLWLLYVHIPKYTQYNIWFAVAALCFDRACRTVFLVWKNIKFCSKCSECKGGQRIGHLAQLRAIGDSTTISTIKDVDLKWRPGQHLYLWIPKLGLFESHPYTIVCARPLSDTCKCNSIQLVVRKHGGFSKRLHQYAIEAQRGQGKDTLTAFVTGPYGAPPRWDIYETLVLISASTGTSFTLPILENVLATKSTNCTKRVHFLLTAKQDEEIRFYVDRLHELMDHAQQVSMELLVCVAITRKPLTPEITDVEGEAGGLSHRVSSSSRVCDPEEHPYEAMNERNRKRTVPNNVDLDLEKCRSRSRSSGCSFSPQIHRTAERANVAKFLRAAVEATGGETSVVVCGGPSLVARTRNCVVALSDERAVHKGTGAQGIHLHAEEYSF